MHPPGKPCEFQSKSQNFSERKVDSPTSEEIKHATLEYYFDVRARVWWMNYIALSLIALCAIGGNSPPIIWWLIAAQGAVTIISFLVLDRPHLKSVDADRAKRQVFVLISIMLVEGALWGLMLLPYMKTLGSDITSTFVCTILIVAVCVASSRNALRPSRVVPYVIGFLAAVYPQCITHLYATGPLPLLLAIGLIPALISLARSVHYQMMRSLITQLENRKLSEQLAESLRLTSYLAKHDALTGLLNRRAFEDAASEFAGTEAAGSSLAIILVDLDHFKSINDSFGHAMGDDVLKKTADCLASGIGTKGLVGRGDAAVARWGGEEFIILVRTASLLSATEMSEQLRLAVIEARADDWPNELLVTGSFGVAIWERGEDLHDAINKADQAMYSAKAAGRNRARAFHEAGCLPVEFLKTDTEARTG